MWPSTNNCGNAVAEGPEDLNNQAGLRASSSAGRHWLGNGRSALTGSESEAILSVIPRRVPPWVSLNYLRS